MQAIPVFADDSTKTKIDFNNGASCIIRTESQIYYTEYSYDDIVVPVYMNLQGISGENLYYSGYIYGNYTAFNFTDSNSNRYVISYFESANENIRTTYFRTTNYWNIYLDNVVISNNNTTLIGYLHLMGNEQNPTLTLNCNNALQTLNVTAHNLYCTEYEFGFINSMVYALDNSANLDAMYDILDHIETASLPEILTTIQTNHTALYNLINSVWLTDQSVLSVSQQTYNTVLSILNILNNIDGALDTVTYKSYTPNILYSSTLDGEYTSFLTGQYNTIYIKTKLYNGVNDAIYFFNNICSIWNSSIWCSGVTIKFYDSYFNELENTVSVYYFNHYNICLVFHPEYLSNSSNDIYISITGNNGNLYLRNDIKTFKYIDNTDIEYYTIYNALMTNKIKNILFDKYSESVNQANAIKDEVDSNLQNLADDIIVEKPSAVANIADDYIEQVDTSHNYQVFSWLTAPTFVLMMSIVAGLAVISYMLYGGQ